MGGIFILWMSRPNTQNPEGIWLVKILMSNPSEEVETRVSIDGMTIIRLLVC